MNRIFEFSVFDEPDPLEQELFNHNTKFTAKTEKDISVQTLEELQFHARNNYLEVESCLLLRILQSSSPPNDVFKHLSFIVADKYKGILQKLVFVVSNQKFDKISAISKSQILWLVDKITENHAQADLNDDIYIWLLKQIRGGDTKESNIWYINALLDILSKNLNWVKAYPRLLKHVIFTFTRIIQDHSHPLENLQKREVEFVIPLINENMDLVISLGRDYIRLLQAVSGIPAFANLWTMLCLHPDSFPSSHFQSIEQILDLPTPKEFIVSRLTPAMEFKIAFIAQNAPLNVHFTYLERFRKQYIEGSSESLVADIIRFILLVIHPTNEILRSDVVYRWQLIQSLFSILRTGVGIQNAKLALFYDWLFMTENDSFMNIEPSILLIERSLYSTDDLPSFGFSLIEFLYLAVNYFCSGWERKCLFHCRFALKSLLEKRVIKSFQGILKACQNTKRLTEILNSLFPMFNSPEIPSMETISNYIDGSNLNSMIEYPTIDLNTTIEKLTLIKKTLDFETFQEVFGEFLNGLLGKDVEVGQYLEKYHEMSFSQEQVSDSLLLDIVIELATKIDQELFAKLIIIYEGLKLNFGGVLLLKELSNILKIMGPDNEETILLKAKQFCTIIMHNQNIKIASILEDIQTQDLDEFYFMFQEIFRYFPEEVQGDFDCILLFLKRVDPKSLSILSLKLLKGEIKLFGEYLPTILLRIPELNGLQKVSFCQLLSAEMSVHAPDGSIEVLLYFCDVYDPDIIPLIAPILLQSYCSREAVFIAGTCSGSESDSEISIIYLSNILSKGLLIPHLESLFDDTNQVMSKTFNYAGVMHDQLKARLEVNEANVCLLLKNLARLQDFLRNNSNHLSFNLSERLSARIGELLYCSDEFIELRKRLIGDEQMGNTPLQ